jgi:hypothetical protein
MADIKSLVEAGKHGEATAELEKLSTDRALAVVDSIEPQKLFVWQLHLYTYATLNGKAGFVLSIVSSLSMPRGVFKNISGVDYDAGRAFILDNLTTMARTNKKAFEARRQSMSKSSFYPDYTEADRRKRVLKFAQDLVDLGPHSAKMIEMFSLGGYFSSTEADSTTQPGGGGTTCALTVRAVLDAAGDRRRTNWVPSGLPIMEYIGAYSAAGKLSDAYVEYKSGSKTQPREGDIYVIDGGDTLKKYVKNGDKIDVIDTGNSSAHTGIIFKIHPVNSDGDWSWETIDGGQTKDESSMGGYWVKRRDRVFKGPDKRLEKDTSHRRLMGWLDLDKIDSWQT